MQRGSDEMATSTDSAGKRGVLRTRDGGGDGRAGQRGNGSYKSTGSHGAGGYGAGGYGAGGHEVSGHRDGSRGSDGPGSGHPASRWPPG